MQASVENLLHRLVVKIDLSVSITLSKAKAYGIYFISGG